MCLVEEEYQLGLFGIPDLWQGFEQFREQPQQESGVDLGRLQQFVCRQDADHSAATFRLHQIGDVEGGFAEEFARALLLESQQSALNRADARGRYVAIVGGEVFCVVADELEHGPQVFHVKEQQAIVVGDLE